MVGAVFLHNMPESELKRRTLPPLRPLVTGLGLDQSWNLFSPDPTRRSIFVEAHLRFADGSRDTVRIPRGERWLGDKRYYRWRKWQRRVRLDDNRELWPATALYFGRSSLEDPRKLVSISLVRRWSDTPDPGSDDPRSWEAYEFFDLDPEPSSIAVAVPREVRRPPARRTK